MAKEPSSYSKVILALANSWRPEGHCFAGKEIEGGAVGPWIRPINSAHKNAISDRDRQYQDESYAEVLDIVRIPLQEPRPFAHHSEDHQIRADRWWAKEGRATWKQVKQATDIVRGPLWHIGDKSFHGKNDKVPEEMALKQKGSLYLIEPTSLSLVVGSETRFGGGSKRRVRAEFVYNTVVYNLVVTDPWVSDRYLAGEDGAYPIQECRICVSLPEIISGSSTKLVAGVITPERAG